MSILSALIDPRLLTSLPDHFNSHVSVQRSQETRNEDNEVITRYIDDEQLQYIACYIEYGGMRGRGEQRTATQTIFTDAFQIVLTGYYPTITESTQVTVYETGQKHNVLRVVHDDTKACTTLITELVNQTGT